MEAHVTILGGTGALGYGLALRLGSAGVQVTIGSRDETRARAAAERAAAAVPHGRFDGARNEEAAAGPGTIVALTVPFASHAATLRAVAPALREGQVVLDATVPLAPAVGGRPTHLLGVWHGSAAQQARALLPAHVGVVSGLHTISAVDLEQLDRDVDQDTLVCGDVREQKAVVIELLGRVSGLRAIDAGRLETSRITESLTPLLIGLNIRNRTHTGIRITGLS
ncbi:NADPH-dependent F420 reductase [Conexibacter sp. JD483]|uniref:NADPH-dependent F420 reductase n=1 Tax=unclassified Conexibacter TaxID=2627773 RepID=UPI002721D65A|nr:MULTISPECIES: NADPH-dependent F420 reductase [unclassified Conexibacter]MDO8187678.1 NADPH-dependent F420 reductase [Conexibacter sp. CPCC 205706]MDO8199863.1 NADPH-dependent F420 reductase [Conexibacter sp. CPCC 205762]MDR9370240.1 NADPH-dependent F420 reductase [Conexibacter sp. JD483]